VAISIDLRYNELVDARIKLKIKINGREFQSREEMPEELRHLYDAALDAAGANHSTKIISNGQEYRSIDDLPSDLRKAYETARTTKPSAGKNPKLVYRRIWLLLGGAIAAFGLIIALGMSYPKGKAPPHLTWALLIPLGLIGTAIYTSIRHWRCPWCGASLPTTSASLGKRECPKCHAEFEL